MSIGDVYVRVGAKMAPGADKTIRDSVVPAADQAGKEAGTKIGSSMSSAMKTALGAVSAAAVVSFFRDSITAASDLEEATSKAGVVFGDAAGQVENFAGTAAAKLGQSKEQALGAASTFAVFGKAAGLSGQSLASFSTDFVGLASDLASFNNTSPEQAIEAIGAALRGETEPIRAYGVMLDDASMRQKALELGIISTTKNALTPQQKVLAAQALIYEQTADAQGDFARTSEGAANSQRVLTAMWADAKAELGEGLLPAAKDLTKALIAAIPAATQFISSFADVAGGGMQLAATLLPVIAEGVDLLVGIMPGGAATVAAFFAAWKLGLLSGVPGALKSIGTELRAGWLEGMDQAGAKTGVFSGKVDALKGAVGGGGLVAALGLGAVAAYAWGQSMDRAGQMADKIAAGMPALRQEIATAVASGSSAEIEKVIAAYDKAAAKQKEYAAQSIAYNANLEAGMAGVSLRQEEVNEAAEQAATSYLLSGDTIARFAEMGYQGLSKVEQAQVQAQQAQQVYDAAVAKHGPTSLAATAAQQQLAAATQQVTAQQQAANAATQTGTQALQEYLNAQLAATNAVVAAEGAKQNVTAAQAAYNQALNAGATSAGAYSAQEQALVTSVTSAMNAVANKAATEAQAAGVTDTSAASTAAAIQYLNEYAAAAGGNIPPAIATMIANLQAQQAAQGATGSSAAAATGKVNDYGSAIISLPPSRTVYVSQSGAEGASEKIKDVKKSVDALTDKTITVTTVYQVEYTGGSGYTPAGTVGVMATGGAVYGPGTGTSDSILRRLSNGEHVLTASEVRRAGGQQAIYALRQAIRDGWRVPGYAAGGAVGPAPSLPSASRPLTISGPIYLEIPDLGVTLRAVARQAAHASVQQYDDRTVSTSRERVV